MASRKQSPPLMKALCHFYFCCLVTYARSQKTDTLHQGQQLKDGEYLISAGRVFTLGFFTPVVQKTEQGYYNSERSFIQQQTASYFYPEATQNRFVGVWYTHDSNKKPIWVANGDKPISGTSGKLEIDKHGNLTISQHGSAPIVLRTNQGSIRILGILTDSGNFVIKEEKSDGSPGGKVIWQSFDYPTDVLVPGMRLGFNLKTGKSWPLTSWVNDQVPARGSFTLGVDPNGTAQLLIWKRGEVYWRSGIWKDKRYHFDYVITKDERYFVFSTVNSLYITLPKYQIGWDGSITMAGPSLESGRQSTLIDCMNKNWNKTYVGYVEHKLPECRRGKWFETSRGYVLSEGFKLDEGGGTHWI